MAALGSKGGVGCHGGKRGLLLPRLSSNTTVSKGSVFSYEMQGLERFRNATEMVCRQSDGKAHVILYQLSEHSILNIQAFKVAWPTCWFFSRLGSGLRPRTDYVVLSRFSVQM